MKANGPPQKSWQTYSTMDVATTVHLLEVNEVAGFLLTKWILWVLADFLEAAVRTQTALTPTACSPHAREPNNMRYTLTMNYFFGDISGMKKKPLKVNLKYYMLDSV